MATLYVTEYATVAIAQIGGAISQAPHEPPLVEQTVAIGGSSTQSAAFNSATTLVRLHCDAICSIVFGTNPVATAANQRFAANQTEYKSVSKGQAQIVAVISNS